MLAKVISGEGDARDGGKCLVMCTAASNASATELSSANNNHTRQSRYSRMMS